MTDAPTLQALTTVAGCTILTNLVVLLALKTLQLAPSTQDRFGPLLAVGVGVVIALLATFTVVTGVGKADIGNGIITGIFAGLTAIGVQNVATKSIVSGG